MAVAWTLQCIAAQLGQYRDQLDAVRVIRGATAASGVDLETALAEAFSPPQPGRR